MIMNVFPIFWDIRKFDEILFLKSNHPISTEKYEINIGKYKKICG